MQSVRTVEEGVQYGYLPKAQQLDRRAYISRAKIALMLEAPEYFFALYGEGKKRPTTKAMELGRRLHYATLENTEFRRNRQIYRMDNLNTIEGRKWHERVQREYPGAPIMSMAEALTMDRIVDRVMSHKLAGELIRGARTEHHGYARCPRTGLLLYSRPDILTTEGAVGELKFVKSVDEFAFNRQQYSDRWFMQLAFYNYVDGLITGTRKPDNCFYIAVETEYPHRLIVPTLHPTYEVMGDILWNEGLDKIRECMERDPQMRNFEVWRAHSNKARSIEPEYFMMNNDPRFQGLIGIGA